MRNHPSLFANPNHPRSRAEIRAFALLIAPIFELEWERAVTSPKPVWRYVHYLHECLVRFERS